MGAKVSFAEKVGYSVGDGAANLVFQLMMMFQLKFYTDVFGLSTVHAGLVFLFVQIFNAFVDPIAGICADRTNSRWGKYRPWVLWTALPFAVAFFLAYAAPSGMAEPAKVAYAAFTFALLMACYSFNNTPYSSLNGVMTGDAEERTSISSVRFVATTLATFVVQGLTLPLVGKFGGGNAAHGWRVTVALYAAAAFVLLVVAALATRERITPPPGQKSSVRQDFADILKSAPWRAMFALTLFVFITLSMWGSAMWYYFDYVADKAALADFLRGVGLYGRPSTGVLGAFGLIAQNDAQVTAVGFSLFNMVGQLVTLVGVLALPGVLSRKFGKKATFLACLALTALCTAAFFWVPSGNFAALFGVNIAKSLAYAPTIPLLWSMMGDVADYGEWANGRRATGIVFAGIVFALKAGLGIGGALCAWILGMNGFVANQAQTAEAMRGIRLVCGAIPAATFAVGVVALLFYPITKAVGARVQAELDARRAARANSGKGTAA